MITIKIDENEKLTVNGNEKHIKDLSPEFLESIVKSALDDNVTFDLKGNNPIVELFKEIQEKTKEGSELREEIRKINNEIIENEKRKGETKEDNYLTETINEETEFI